MKTTYQLKPGSYFLGDPAVIVSKSEKGGKFLEKLWEVFYKNPNEFQEIKILGVKFYVTRTEGGDGVFNGIGTDTGVYIICDVKEFKNKKIFKENLPKFGCKVLTYDHPTEVYVENFNIYFEDFVVETE